jgi:hypothetical protein
VAIKGRDLLRVARELSGGRRPPPEPAARTAVNRAYYAAYSEVFEYISARNYHPRPGGGSHQRAWNHLKSRIPDTDLNRRATRRLVASQGEDLKERRVTADYRLRGSLRRGDPQESIAIAEKMIAELDRLTA